MGVEDGLADTGCFTAGRGRGHVAWQIRFSWVSSLL